jgi:hypothetical protein
MTLSELYPKACCRSAIFFNSNELTRMNSENHLSGN